MALPEPTWVLFEREYPKEKRIADFKNKLSGEKDPIERTFLREWIQYLTHGETSYQQPYKKQDFGKFSWKASITGFHNPKKHKGITINAFYTLYMNRLKDRPEKKEMYSYLQTIHAEIIHYIQTNFRHTLTG